MNKSFNDLYKISKLYNKYLLTVKAKIINTDSHYIFNIDKFNESTKIAEQIFEEIKNDCFFILNHKNISQFRLNNTDNMINNFYDNFYALEYIAKQYGFDNWYITAKYKLSSSSNKTASPTNINLLVNI